MIAWFFHGGAAAIFYLPALRMKHWKIVNDAGFVFKTANISQMFLQAAPRC